ncbi:MAG: hypothetical protein ABIG44_08905 [Planctomycetota bacterium]
MKLSKRDRLALIVLMGGVAALCVDKLLFPPLRTASATGQEATALSSSLLAATSQAMNSQDFELDKLPELPPIPNVFDLKRVETLDLRAAPPARGQLAQQTLDLFVKEHTLHAIIFGPNPIALVGYRKFQVGDQLDGFVLESISEREAVFLSDAGRAVLRMGNSRKSP